LIGDQMTDPDVKIVGVGTRLHPCLKPSDRGWT
jgi:hypothetical protein